MTSIDIAEVARRTGLTTRALRFYEARGLVAPLRTASGRRLYGTGELARLGAVLALKRAGLTLAAIGRLLAGRETDLPRLVAGRLAEVEARLADLAATRALLLDLRSRLASGEPIDGAALCSLIQQEKTMDDRENWQAVSERYLSAEAKAGFAAATPAMPAGFDQQAYTAAWRDLSDRIAAALPLDPTGPAAQALYAEWQALLAPFTAIATPAMRSDVTRMYDRMGEWQAEQTPPFAPEVWAFIRAVGAGRRDQS